MSSDLIGLVVLKCDVVFIGEAMEKGLRECCRSMRIGKILIRRDQETRQPQVRLMSLL